MAWEDIHEGYLTVRHSLQRQKGEWVLAPTKTEKSARVVPLTAGARDALRRHRLAMAEERTPTWRYHGLVFTTPRGEPMYAWHVLEALYAAEDRLGLPRVSFHGLRHSYSSIMATEGADRRHLADMLGHSTTRLTDDLYRHVAPPSLERLRDLMERAVEG